jgi:hypothetical protein
VTIDINGDMGGTLGEPCVYGSHHGQQRGRACEVIQFASRRGDRVARWPDWRLGPSGADAGVSFGMSRTKAGVMAPLTDAGRLPSPAYPHRVISTALAELQSPWSERHANTDGPSVQYLTSLRTDRYVLPVKYETRYYEQTGRVTHIIRSPEIPVRFRCRPLRRWLAPNG